MGETEGPNPLDPAQPPALAGRNFVKDGDLRILTAVGLVAMSVLIVFGMAVYWSGILDFPALPQDTAGRDYVNDSLIYRERRMAMSLVMRTFLTGFSFVVGLALCTMGGLFILRQVSSLTTLSGNLGPGANMLAAGDAAPREVAERLQKTQFSFSSYSPGVLFMVGGVTIIVVTQLLAIPIRAVEIVPGGAAALCVDPETGNHGSCPGAEAGQGPAPAAADDGGTGDEAGNGGGVVVVAEGADGGAGFATSEAVEVPGPPVIAAPSMVFVAPAALADVALPDGHAVTGLSLENLLVEGPGGSFVFDGWTLDYGAADWGIVLPAAPDAGDPAAD